MHPAVHARANPDKPAIIVAETGEAISYGELDAAANRAAQLFRSHGLGHEDVVAFMLDNTPHYYGLTWGAQRAGLRYVCISRSEERRVGKECVSTCRSRWSRYH